jgi:nucleotide-binding universal stress UspA family protein
MAQKLLHVFRNTPLGRETLLQSIYFCRKMAVQPSVYIPKSTRFLMYFENSVVQVDLDRSYRNDPDTAATPHVEQLLEAANIKPELITPKNYTTPTLPDIPTNFEFMCAPRCLSDLSSRIGLGHIGPRIRRILRAARFPVLITSPAYKPWQSIAVLFGGSVNAVNALRLEIRIAGVTGMRLDIYTQVRKNTPSGYRAIVQAEGLGKPLQHVLGKWTSFEKGRLETNLYEVPHDALVIMGAYGHGIIRDILRGSMLEKIQAAISNNLLIAGHRTMKAG